MDVYHRQEILDDHQVWLDSDGERGAQASFWKAALDELDFSKANLRIANMRGASLIKTRLRDADLRGADLVVADLTGADLRGADLRDAQLNGAKLNDANLSGADLSGADLRHANLVRTNLQRARLTKCSVYGASVWDLKIDARTEQSGLVVTPADQPVIAVDNLEVAQFVYLLLNNEKIRGVVNTIGEKGVLILGRFTPDRKAVLDAIWSGLRERGFVPMMFDFERPTQRDFSETIKTLAGMSRFIVADITNPRSSPLEFQATMPDYMIPFVPIIHEDEKPFAMFRDLQNKYGAWVLDVLKYDTVDSLIAALEHAVIRPALKKSDELLLEKAEAIRERHVRDYL
jgi:hypothetical protein